MSLSVIQRLNERRDAAGDAGEDSGFTLIELMVVLLILAILLAIAIPTFLGVTGGANDRAAQSNLNTALTNAKSSAEQANQSYATLTTTSLNANEPAISWVTGSTSTQGPVSVYIDANAATDNGGGIVMASYSKNAGGCWFIVDNIGTVSVTGGNGPYVTATSNGSTTSAPTNPGTFYGFQAKQSATSCTPAAAPTAASWSQSSFSAV